MTTALASSLARPRVQYIIVEVACQTCKGFVSGECLADPTPMHPPLPPGAVDAVTFHATRLEDAVRRAEEALNEARRVRGIGCPSAFRATVGCPLGAERQGMTDVFVFGARQGPSASGRLGAGVPRPLGPLTRCFQKKQNEDPRSKPFSKRYMQQKGARAIPAIVVRLAKGKRKEVASTKKGADAAANCAGQCGALGGVERFGSADAPAIAAAPAAAPVATAALLPAPPFPSRADVTGDEGVRTRSAEDEGALHEALRIMRGEKPRGSLNCYGASDADEGRERVSEPPDLAVGDVIEVHGLRGAVELSGRRGAIVHCAQGSPRVGVVFQGVEGVKAVKPTNLVRMARHRRSEAPGVEAALNWYFAGERQAKAQHPVGHPHLRQLPAAASTRGTPHEQRGHPEAAPFPGPPPPFSFQGSEARGCGVSGRDAEAVGCVGRWGSGARTRARGVARSRAPGQVLGPELAWILR